MKCYILVVVKDRGGDDNGPFEYINPKFPWKDEGKPRRTSVKTAVNPTEIRNGCLPKAVSSDAATPTCTVHEYGRAAAIDALHTHNIRLVLEQLRWSDSKSFRIFIYIFPPSN
jgi:hypothetical protein